MPFSSFVKPPLEPFLDSLPFLCNPHEIKKGKHLSGAFSINSVSALRRELTLSVETFNFFWSYPTMRFSIISSTIHIGGWGNITGKPEHTLNILIFIKKDYVFFILHFILHYITFLYWEVLLFWIYYWTV